MKLIKKTTKILNHKIIVKGVKMNLYCSEKMLGKFEIVY